jgi:tetratricopeptide (TPR) repeat protein
MKPTDYYQQFRPDYHASGGKNMPRKMPENSLRGSIFLLVWVLLLGLVQVAWGSNVSNTSGPVTSDAKIAVLIEQLKSDDAVIRRAAAAAITSMGEAARPAILNVSHSKDPGVRQQAIQILLNLPWYLSTDPPTVKQILLGYGSPEVEVRRDLIRGLAELDNDAGLGALDRLMFEEPSPAVQWTIVTCLRADGNLNAFRNITPPADNSRLLALCGYAKLSGDLAGAIEDLRQCAELEFADPVDDRNEFDFVIRVLTENACLHKEYKEAADWRRRELARGSVPDASGIPDALLELFALQADFGPIEGLQDDIRRAGDDIHRPKLQYALSRMYGRMGDAAKAEAAQKAAFAGSGTRMQRYDVGDFLCEHGWNDLAEAELQAYLKMDSPDEGIETREADANVHLRLASIAIEKDDDETAAHEKEQAMLLLPDGEPLTKEDGAGHRWTVPPNAVWAEIYWRYLRAAISAHNDSDANRRIEQLLHLHPTDPDIAIEVVPLLRQRGRKVDADLMFQWAYDDMKKDLDSDPGDPEKLNGIAWLCAKCDRDLPDALVWAQKAASLAPDNAAILDTEAEVNFHLGHADESIRLESEALAIEPGDDFMKSQLARFKAAVNNPATRPN